MKRILLLIIALSLVLTSLSLIAYADENVTVDVISSEGTFLKTLKIPNFEIASKEKLTRAEFVTLVVSLLYPDDSFVYAQDGIVFSDVDEKHDLSPYIKAAKDLKIITGTTDSYFMPDKIISVTDASVVLINALGYAVHANAEGGYPAGHLAVAGRAGLLKGVKVQSELSGLDAQRLLYNALFVDEVSIRSIENGELTLEKNPFSNLLSSRYKIYKYDAMVVNTPFTSLDGSEKVDMGTVVIETVSDKARYLLYTPDSAIENEIGKRLSVYVKTNPENGKNEVVFYKAHNNVKITTVSTDKILTVNSSYIEYETDDYKIKKINCSGYPYVLYNGCLQSVYNQDIFKSKEGLVTFIDNDGNGNAEVIDIIGFKFGGTISSYGYIVENRAPWTIVVDRVDIEGEFITCRWNPVNNISLDSNETVYRIISDNDEIKTLSDIKKDDIVSVALCPEKIDGKIGYILAVSRNSISGLLTSYNKNENIITVEEEEYTVSESIYSVRSNYMSNLVTGRDIKLSLGYTGKVAYIGNLQTSSNNYAYLISAAIRSKGDDYVVVKVFDKGGAINEYILSENVKIDGISYKGKSATEKYQALIKRDKNYSKWIKDNNGTDNTEDDTYYEENISRPMIIKVNSDDEISFIDTDNPNYKGSGDILPNTYATANKIGYNDQEVYDTEALKAGYRSPRLIGHKAAGSSVEGKFFVTSDTYVFSVPDIDTCGFNDYGKYMANPSNNSAPTYDIVKYFELEKTDENYRMLSSSDLIDGFAYDIQGYNIDPDTGIAEMVVLRGRDAVRSDSDYNSPMAVYLKKTKYYDETLEKEVYKIYYTQDGVKELSVIADTESMFILYDYLISGRKANDSDNIYEVDIPELKTGDIIRLSTSGEYLTHIERVYILDELYDTYSSISHPSTSISYRISGSSTTRVMDVRNTWGGNNSTINLFAVTPNQVKGNTVSAYMGLQKISSINLNDPTSYTEQYIDVSGLQPILIIIKKDGTIETDEGSISDIISIRDTGSVDGTSLLIYRHARFKINQLIIVNDERGI